MPETTPLGALSTGPAPTCSGAPLVTLTQAAVRLGRQQALAPLSLSLARGERVVLVGPNGAGKTTLLRLLHGLLPHVGQRTLHTLEPEGRAAVVAMVFQRPFLLDLTVAWNIRIALALRGLRWRDTAERAAQALERVGLAALARRRARELSGGQQQRVALARAWAAGADLLLLDEPTASLDPAAQREIEALVAGFAAEGTTVVMSTHQLGQARRLGQRVLCLDEGQLVADLPVEQFFGGGPLPDAAQRFLEGELPSGR